MRIITLSILVLSSTLLRASSHLVEDSSVLKSYSIKYDTVSSSYSQELTGKHPKLLREKSNPYALNDSYFDLIVYGATPSGISSAIAAKRNGVEKVLLIEPLPVVGGRMSEALGFPEQRRMVPYSYGSFWVELYELVGEHYGKNTIRPEPHVMQGIFNRLLQQNNVEVKTNTYVKRVERESDQISAIITSDDHRVSGNVFIDATYTGDLLPLAGVSWTTEREGREKYDESLAGVILKLKNPPGEIVEDIYKSPISGFNQQGDLLPHVQGLTTDVVAGEGDQRHQAFNLYQCITRDTLNSKQLSKPKNYNPNEFELLRREIKRLGKVPFGLHVSMANQKGHLNDNVPILMHWGLVGGGNDHATATPEERRDIYRMHKEYTHRLLWFLQNDVSIPDSIRQKNLKWGLPKDEFTENEYWAWDVYIREGRRMVGSYVMTQSDLFFETMKEDAVAIGSFPIDSHAVTRLASPDRKYVVNEGGYLVAVPPYQIPYRALLPKEDECSNLLVPVALSTSRVAFNSIRVEPIWVNLGQVAGIVASMYSDLETTDLHDISIDSLQSNLNRNGIPYKLEE